MKKFLRKIRTVGRQLYVSLRDFKRYFSRREKITLLILAIITIVSIVLWSREARADNGICSNYTEGWLLENGKVPTDYGRLTKAGLLKYNQNGELQNDISSKWEHSDDKLTYIFHLKAGFHSGELVGYIQQNQTIFGAVNISTPDDSTIVFKLKQPLNAFIQNATAPIFPYGPYEIEKQNKIKAILKVRDNYHLSSSCIKKVEIIFYKNKDDLKRALNKGRINATADLDEDQINLKVQRLALPRFISIFINTRNNPLDNKSIREKIVKGQDVSEYHLKTLKLVVVNAPEVLAQKDQIISKLQNQRIKLDVEQADTSAIAQKILPQKDYDLLLMGIDYGYSNDYYPFWHSFQADKSGTNITGIKNKDLDIKLEKARMSTDNNEKKTLLDEAKNIINSQFLEIPLKEEILIYQSNSKVQNNNIGFIAEPLDRFDDINQWVVE